MMKRERIMRLIQVLEKRVAEEQGRLSLLDQQDIGYASQREIEADLLTLAKYWVENNEDSGDESDDEKELNQLNQLIEEALEMWTKTNKVQYLSEIRKLLNDRRAWKKGDDTNNKQVPQQLQISFLPFDRQEFANDEKDTLTSNSNL